MTIESLGRKGGPKPGDLGAAPRHSRRPQPETRIVPTARPKPAPPRTPPGIGEARRAVPQPPAQRVQGAQGTQGTQGAPGDQRNPGSQAPQTQQAQQGPQAQAPTQARVTEAKPARPPEARAQTQTARDRGPASNPASRKPEVAETARPRTAASARSTTEAPPPRTAWVRRKQCGPGTFHDRGTGDGGTEDVCRRPGTVRSPGLPRHVGMTGFEPATSCPQSTRATKLRHIPVLATAG